MANVFMSLLEILLTILAWGWLVVLAIWVVYQLIRGLFYCLTYVVIKVATKDIDITIHKDDP